ncbi:MAG: hypothetical protein GWP09_02855 [Nitrospiraceae bacterium]|nr:hypothetical protein [Nitrospiraceae bacterium]
MQFEVLNSEGNAAYLVFLFDWEDGTYQVFTKEGKNYNKEKKNKHLEYLFGGSISYLSRVLDNLKDKIITQKD